MVGSPSLVVGWVVHLVISAVFGVTWLAFAGSKGGVVRGLAYGVAVWVFGPLSLMSLLGHLVYGLVTALAFSPLVKVLVRPSEQAADRASAHG